jgi:hypothetical protein
MSSKDGKQALSGDCDMADMIWKFDVGSGQFLDDGLISVSIKPLQLQLRRQAEPNQDPSSVKKPPGWKLVDAEYLSAVISLSACSKAVLDDQDQHTMDFNFPRRIDGHSSVKDVKNKVDKLGKSAQNPSLGVEKVVMQEREKDAEHPETYGWRPSSDFWCLGLFLSSYSRYIIPKLPSTLKGY